MAVAPRHDVRRLRVRLRGYVLAVPFLAAAVVVGHRWVPESWSVAIETALFVLAVHVLFGEIRAYRLRGIHPVSDGAGLDGQQR